MTVTASNPFAMLLDPTAAMQAHEKVLSSLRSEVHRRADALPRHLQADVLEFDTAIETAARSGVVTRVRIPKSKADGATTRKA